MTGDELFISGRDHREKLVSSEEISEILAQYGAIEEYESFPPRFVVSDKYRTLSPREQVLVSLLAAEMVYRNDLREECFISTTELFNRYVLNANTHYPYIRNLEQNKIVERRNPNLYSIKTEELEAVVAEL